MDPSIQFDKPSRLTKCSSWFRLPEASLHPPAYLPDEEGAETDWVLLDWRAYVAERHNSTTAFSETWDGKPIQVTLCLVPPPRVSYLCVFCPGWEFPLEPKILAMEDDLMLLRVIATSNVDVFKDMDYYIYQAADETGGGGPSLKRLPRPPSPYGFDSHHVGILRCGTSHQYHPHALRPHGDVTGDFYIVTALCSVRDNIDPMHYVLLLLNSKFPSSWSEHNISLNEHHQDQYGYRFRHVNSKVIAIGGHAGTMGFVDLWRGILFCDVLKANPALRYVRLPPPILPDMSQTSDARLFRDIAVIQQGRTIKYVELQPHLKPCPTSSGYYLKDGWVCRTWSRSVDADCSEGCWELGRVQESSDIPVDRNPHFELLPKMLNAEGMPLEPFKGLAICQPTLSLNDDDDGIVYFMTKKRHGHPKAWVIAVDTKNNTLQGVAEFPAERTVLVSFAYVHSRISKYLMTSSVTKRNLKRPGMVLLGSCNKKPGFWMSMPPWDDEQKQHSAEMEGSGEDMALD